MEALVIGAEKWDYQSKDGQHKRGMRVTYLAPAESGPNRTGLEAVSVPAVDGVWSQLVQVPGYYRLNMEVRPGVRGMPIVRLIGVEAVGPAEIPLTCPVKK